MLEVGGFVPMSTTDWPDHLAAVVFVQGCPWRCHYCHNRDLQPREAGTRAHPWPDLLAKLGKRQGLLDGVVFSGGEPTLDSYLFQAMRDVKALGLKVGLHTAGIYPDRIAALLPLVDWVGFDVKANFADYEKTTDVPRSGQPAWRSLISVIQSGLAYEIRTTYHPDLHDDEQMLQLAATLRQLGVQDWVIQGFRPTTDTPATLGSSLRHPGLPLQQRLADGGLRVQLR
ncbi:MAG: anaerobic ribonucleoside-triphosphate reductase activating protein [Acidobacteriota bacterium]